MFVNLPIFSPATQQHYTVIHCYNNQDVTLNQVNTAMQNHFFTLLNYPFGAFNLFKAYIHYYIIIIYLSVHTYLNTAPWRCHDTCLSISVWLHHCYYAVVSHSIWSTQDTSCRCAQEHTDRMHLKFFSDSKNIFQVTLSVVYWMFVQVIIAAVQRSSELT